MVKTENLGRKKQAKREYLNNKLTRELIKKLELHLEKTVDIPLINVGNKQTIETLIYEEALLLAKCLRNWKEKWNPRVTVIYSEKRKGLLRLQTQAIED